MEQLTGQVWLGDVQEVPQMLAEGVTWFADLRTDAGPPIDAANTERFPLERSAPDGDGTLAWAAHCVKMRVDQGKVVGICGHGQKDSAEALGLAYLMAMGYSLSGAQRFWRKRFPGHDVSSALMVCRGCQAPPAGKQESAQPQDCCRPVCSHRALPRVREILWCCCMVLTAAGHIG